MDSFTVRLAYRNLIILIVLFASLGMPRGAASQAGCVVYIHPAAAQVALDGSVWVRVRVENVIDLYAYDLEITFDPALVKAEEVTVGNFLPVPEIFSWSVDNDKGVINYAVWQKDPAPPKSGDGVLLNIRLAGLGGVGVSPIEITKADLSDIDGGAIVPQLVDGEVSVVEDALFNKVYLPLVLR
jgi:hypothetical protein